MRAGVALAKRQPNVSTAAYYLLQGNTSMSKMRGNETTSARVATLASRVLRNPTSKKAEKSAAASALTQRVPPRKKR